MGYNLAWLQSLKQFFTNVSYHILRFKTEPSELDWLQVYDNDTLMKIVLRTGASLGITYPINGSTPYENLLLKFLKDNLGVHSNTSNDARRAES